jgi:hypothetical protein
MATFRRKSSDTVKAALRADELSEAIAQYHHRILSLEAELREEGRLGHLSARDFSRRVQKLKTLHGMLRELQQYSVAEKQEQAAGLELGLPPLVDGSPDESEYCRLYLDLRIKRTNSLTKQIVQISHWLKEATHGQTGILAMILRLSKLRSMVGRACKEVDSLTQESLEQHSTVVRLVKSLGKSADGNELSSLVSVFDEVEGLISRVAKLRAGVKKETLRTRAMTEWLEKEETKLRDRRPDMSPVSPMALGKVAATFRQPIARSDGLLRQYWDEVVRDPAPFIKKEQLVGATNLMAQSLTLSRGRVNREGA